MMYSEKLAVAIKASGKVLREFDTDKVYLPFGSEYSIFIKNLNAVRASVKISIDGRDVLGGSSLVIQANSSLDLERFLDNGNEQAGNKFKFIERNAAVEGHRGIGAEDGLVRIEWQFEKPFVWDFLNKPKIHSGGLPRNGYVYYSNSTGSPPPFGDDYTYCDTFGVNSLSSDAPVAVAAPAGITAEGSRSDQSFQTVSNFPLELASHVMVFKLLGQQETVQVTKPVTVKVKTKCKTCGNQAKASAKFCPQCGTSLQIVS